MPPEDPRVRALNEVPVRTDGRYVLYWMTSARRASWSFALDRAVAHARALRRPLIVLEALRAGYPYASDRLHAFVLQGMADNAEAFARAGVLHHAYVEPAPGDGRGLLERLAADACVVVTDDFPAFFLPRMNAATAARLRVRLEAVDGNGLLPMRAAPRLFPTAFAFRAFLQAELPAQLGTFPSPAPFRGRPLPPAGPLPEDVRRRWPGADPGLLSGTAAALAPLPIDHAVAPVAIRGGTATARLALRRFVEEKLPRYAEDRNHPDLDATSGLSPYLHFGHLSAHEAFQAVADHEGWDRAERVEAAPPRRGGRTRWPGGVRAGSRRGSREGWWGMSASAEAFLDQLVTWRELGLNLCSRREDYLEFESLPPWALATLRAHAADPRPHRYGRAALELAETHDPLWNAAQRQLLAEGRIHNYLRMLWGKKVLEWSASPEEAFATLVALNDRYALDGRDPNSYSAISWCLGRYDRPWGPERPIFGTVRYMSSENTARKVRLRAWLARWSEPSRREGARPVAAPTRGSGASAPSDAAPGTAARRGRRRRGGGRGGAPA